MGLRRARQTRKTGPQEGQKATGAHRAFLPRLAVSSAYRGLLLLLTAGGIVPPTAEAVETWRILAVRVSFPREEPDDETTSGNGTFDLRPTADVQDSLRFPYDTPPHDKAYFDAHLQALANYYRDISQGQLEIDYEVYPGDSNSSYVLPTPLKEYGNGRTQQEIDERQTRLFRDGIAAADSAEGEGLDFSNFRAFAVFHAGLGAEAGQQALNDIPSAFIAPPDLARYAGGPIRVDNGAGRVTGGMLLPEAISTDGRGGLNGTLARFFANQLGLQGLSNFEDGLPAVGDWSLMDTGNIGVASSARLGLKGLSAEPADTVLLGFIPSRMLAWSRIQLGWLTPKTVTHNDTVQVVAPHVVSDLPQAVKVPISATEYFLLENRISRLALKGRVPSIAFSRQDGGGVWLSVDDYDAFIPGSGLLIWHVDDTVIRASDNDHPINSNPGYRIASDGISSQFRRGITLEEADGLEDIGNVSAGRIVQSGIISLSSIQGGPQDPFYVGNTARFGPDTTPNTSSNLGYSTGFTIEVLSPPGDTMAVAITLALRQGAWPVTGLPPGSLQAPRALDLDGDGQKEIIRGAPTGHSAWTLNGSPFNAFQFSASVPPAVGNLVTGGAGAGRTEFIFGDGGTPILWVNGRFIPTPGDEVAPRNAVVSAAPVIAPFPGSASADIWGWSDGRVEWGKFAGESGSADLGPEPVAALAVGNIDEDPSNELIALTQTGRIAIVEGPARVRRLAALQGPAVGAPVLADLDRSGVDEVVLVTANGVVSILNNAGLVAQSVPVPGGAVSPPVLADLDGDGFVEALFGGSGCLWAVRFNGVLQTGAPLAFPLKDEAGPIGAPPVLADLDGDGAPEILAGSQGGLLYGLRGDGTPLPGFPLSVSGPIRTSPILDDLDGDGTLELVLFTANGAVHLWHLEEVAPDLIGNRIVWGQLGGGSANTGHLLMSPQAAPEDPSPLLLPSGRVYCYPNPIRGSSATLRFFLGNTAQIRVVVLNALGEIVDRLSLENPVPRTDNEIFWDTSDYASGLYICRVEAVSTDRSEVRFVKAAVIK